MKWLTQKWHGFPIWAWLATALLVIGFIWWSIDFYVVCDPCIWEGAL